MRRFLLLWSLAGSLLFGVALLVSFARPLVVERAAREVVRIEVEERVGERLEALSDATITALARRALQANEQAVARQRQAVQGGLPAKVAGIVAAMQRADCPCRERLQEQARRWQQSRQERLASLEQVGERLTGLVESAYAAVSDQLLREFRIVAVSNAAAFAAIGLVVLVRRAPGPQAALCAGALTGAVAIVGATYLFKQDWLHTIVFDDYAGLAYSLWLAVVALMLVDLLLNRSRVSGWVVQAAVAAGSAVAGAFAAAG